MTSAEEADSAPVQPAEPAQPARPKISEDWIATILGLTLMLLAIAGVITKAMVP